MPNSPAVPDMPVRAWQCPNCSALISERIIGDPPDSGTQVRCHECGNLVALTTVGVWLPLDGSAALASTSKDDAGA